MGEPAGAAGAGARGMKVLITGVCGFVGRHLATELAARLEDVEIVGIDNLSRSGSESNRSAVATAGVRFIHGDLRMRSDVDALPACDWVIDAAANASVLAGVDGRSSMRQLGENNLGGTINVLEYCRERRAGLVLLSTSRVYSVRDLSALPVSRRSNRFVLDSTRLAVDGVSAQGIGESFPVRQPISLYGASKLCSEVMALEYGNAAQFPVFINRCGNLAGAGQFGTAEQGIFSYWIDAHSRRAPLRFIGFEGSGCQVRDAFHPADLADLIYRQIRRDPSADPIYNVGGGVRNCMSMAQLAAWCDARFGLHRVESDVRPRMFDIPWMAMDSSRASREFRWAPARSLESILEEIASHARKHPEWAQLSGAAAA